MNVERSQYFRGQNGPKVLLLIFKFRFNIDLIVGLGLEVLLYSEPPGHSVPAPTAGHFPPCRALQVPQTPFIFLERISNNMQSEGRKREDNETP